MKLLFPSLAILFLNVSCNLQPKEVKQLKQTVPDYAQEETQWLEKLAQWGVTRYNDSAKWRIYCYYGDDTSTLGTENRPLPLTPLAFLDLKLAFAVYKKNRLSLLYEFLYNDSTHVRYIHNRNKEFSNLYKESFGVEFDVKADTVIGYTLQHGTFREEGPMRRYENFTHPDWTRFMNENTNRLHPWFRNEAIRRRLLTK